MGFPIPQYIANVLVEIGDNLEFQKLNQVIFSVIKQKIPSKSDEEVWDYAEQYEGDIAKELFIKTNDNRIDGITLNFNIIEEDDGFYIKFLETPEILLLRRLQGDTSDNFEIFCKKILDKLGGKSSVEGGTDDGGIDFTAYDLKLHNLPFLSTKGSRIFLIGQAKRYKDGNHVKEKEVKYFIGCSVQRIEEIKKTRAEQFGIFQPIILAFWTTSDFHVDAKNAARDFGIWYLSGIALCQLAIQLGVEY